MSANIAILFILFGLIAPIGLAIVLIPRNVRRLPPTVAARRPHGAAASPAKPDLRLPYERIPTLLTMAERDFFAVLQQAAPAGHQIFPQVRLANLVQVKASARRDKAHWWRIQAKCVDFVLIDTATFAPRLVVEHDDSSHNRADRRDRDMFVDDVLAAVDLPILHVRWQRRYDPRALAEQIAGRLGVIAPVPAAASDMLPAPVPTGVPAGVLTIAPAALAPFRHTCSQCQAELREGAKFCAQCGAIVR